MKAELFVITWLTKLAMKCLSVEALLRSVRHVKLMRARTVHANYQQDVSGYLYWIGGATLQKRGSTHAEGSVVPVPSVDYIGRDPPAESCP